MSANDEEINRREVAWRLFASEFRDADFSYAESDEERAPNYVVTPTGARVNRLFVVGVLTEVEYVSDDYLRARIVDPTGAFVVYAGQYQPEALTFLENAETPTFVAVTGKARTFQPDDSDIVYTSIRPEAISEVDAASRDNWVVTTAEQTLERVATMADALDLVERGDDLRAVLEARHVPQGLAAGIPLAIDHYDTTEHYLAAIRDVSLDAARVVSGEREEVQQYRIDPNDEGDEPVDLGLDEFTLVTGDAQPVTTTEPEEVESSTDVDAEGTAETEVDEVEVEETETDEVDAAAVGASSGTTESEPAEPATEPEETEAETEPASTADSTVETEGPDESETVDEAQVESEAQSAEAEAETDAEAETEAVDTDEMYELSEEERQEVEENYDVEFSTADEVEGKAGIEPETPEPDTDATETEEPEAKEAAEEETAEDLAFDAETDEEAEETAAEFEAEHEDEEDAEPSDEESEGTTTENLEDAVVETMQSLGDGDGADRDELVQTIVEERGVDQDAVEDAIQDALMSGRCYESGDNELTAI